MKFYERLGVDTVFAKDAKDIYPLTSELYNLLKQKEFHTIDRVFKQTNFRRMNLLCIVTLFRSTCNHIRFIPEYRNAIQQAIKQIQRCNQDPLRLLRGLIEIDTDNENPNTLYKLADRDCDTSVAFLERINVL